MGILLASTSDLIAVVSTSTSPLHVTVDYIDFTAPSTFAPSPQYTAAINTATTTTIASSPASSVVRNVKQICIENTDTNATTITVQRTNGTITSKIKTLSLAAGYSFQFAEGRGWYTLDSNGIEVVDNVQGPGLFIQSTTLSTGTTFTTSSRTNKLRIRAVGGGGQGGGNPTTAGTVGAGGGSGAYAEWTVPCSPSTGYTYAIGAGGSTGGTGASGQAGGSTTIVINGVTLTVPGGGGGTVGGVLALNALGGAGGALPTLSSGSPNLAMGGDPGGNGSASATAGDTASGSGGSSTLGGGAVGLGEASNTTGNSAAALGFGGGGGGSATSAATARAGGAGASGAIIVDEYTG